MNNMTLTQIAAACNGQLVGSGYDSGKTVAGVVIDSRKVEKDYLFIATEGNRVDGHSFIDKAFEQGAMAVVCQRPPESGKGPYILVENSFVALKEIAKWYRSNLDITVVGITGSVGKTSTKEFIANVLSQKYDVLKTEGNFNNEVGLPLTILRIRDNHEVAVLEMGISDFNEMHRLSEIARPDICVITNIGECHLENLGSRQGVLKAKTEMFNFMKENGSVVLYGDDDMLATIEKVNGKRPFFFGKQPEFDVYATDIISKGLFGSTCDIHVKNDTIHVDVPLPGSHMVLNAMAATCVGTLLDMTCEDIKHGIESVKPVGGRSNIMRLDSWTIIDDCYNANPVSMRAAIDLLNMADNKKVAILGDMFELGPNEKQLHREIGMYAAKKNVDVIICVGKLSANMYEGAKEVLQSNSNESLSNLHYFETLDEAISALPSILKQNDTILVKASHSMGFENIVKALI